MQAHEDRDEVPCALGVALGDGAWLWRIEAHRRSPGFAVVILDGETDRRWPLAATAEPYTWQRFAGFLCHWRPLARRLKDGLGFSWITTDEFKFLTVSGAAPPVASVLRFCLASGDGSLTRWLAGQSDASINVLFKALPNPLSGARQLILEELAEWVEELQLPPDLLELCRRYGLDDPGTGLVGLRERLAGDMASVTEVRRARVDRLHAQIAALAAEFRVAAAHAGGTDPDALATRLIHFLTSYVAQHDALPARMHDVPGLGHVDFDELRRRRQLQSRDRDA